MDDFFSYGPGVPFTAHDVFTDRDEPLARLHQRCVAHATRPDPDPDLLDFQRPATNLVTVLGEGGIGKSTLARRVAALATDGTWADLPDRRAAAVLDLADPASAGFETLLLRLRTALAPLARSWPAFDLALAAYWARKHPGESLADHLREHGSAEGRRVADQVTGVVDQFAGGFGVATLAIAAARHVGRTAAQKARLRRLRAELPALDPILAEDDPDLMIGYMPVLLAADLERARARAPRLALCVLDTVETVQRSSSERGGPEDLIARLVYLMPNVLFLAAGRSPLGWHDPVRSVGLTYGGAHRWPGLTGPDQWTLPGFDPAAADAYLRARVTIDDRPAISTATRERIVTGSGGSPLYLDLSAELCQRHLARGTAPPASAFGRGFPELVLRTLRDLTAEDRDLLRAASLVEAFDAGLLHAVVPSVRRRRIETFTARAFVRHDPSVWPPYRLHETLRESVRASDAHLEDGWTPAERREHLTAAFAYLAEAGLAVWDERTDHPVPQDVRSRRSVAAFLIVLRAAAEIGAAPPVLADLAFTLSVLGHRQVLAGLPAYPDVPELDRLTAFARLAARGDLNAEDRYRTMRGLVPGEPDGPFADYLNYELGTAAHLAGLLDTAIAHLSVIPPDGSLIGASALFGLADNALRRSDLRAVAELMDKASGASLDRVRVADMLGHTHLHAARFARAARFFETALDEARAANAPVWEARALRHLALALMWCDPDRALGLVPHARELSAGVGELIGVAQCDLAASVAHALLGDAGRAAELLADAVTRFADLATPGELLPVEALQVLQHVLAGQADQAAVLARRLADAERDGTPACPPVWVFVTCLWTDVEPPPIPRLTWPDEADEARARWRAPLRRFCGPLDVGDRAGHVPTERLDPAVPARVARDAARSEAFDGDATSGGTAVVGRRTVLKVQHRTHERFETVLRFERLRDEAGVRAPRLLDAGRAGDGTWWAVLERLPGAPGDAPTPAQQREIGRQLRRWHTSGLDGGLRLDDPGALGVLLGSARRNVPLAYPVIAGMIDAACRGAAVTPIHGDLAVGHNALFEGDTLAGVLDPGAVEHGPPALDLAWALAVDLPRGGRREPLLDGYGAVDRPLLEALVPLMMLRRLIDVPHTPDGRRLADLLAPVRPDLLALVTDELGL